MENVQTLKNQLTPISDMLDMFMPPSTIVGSTVVDGSTIESRVVLMTPSLAKRILNERNTLNRKLNKINVNLLAKDMTSGKWQFNGDSIRFNTKGILSDGQHRLSAIVKSGKAQPMIVISGIEEESFETIDIGFKRSTSDILSMNNIENPTLTSIMVKFVYAYRNGKYSANRNTVRNLSNQDVIPYYETLSGFQDSVNFIKEVTKGQQNLITKGTLGGLHYEMSKINKSLADTFIRQVITGVGLEDLSPITALRNKLIKAKTNNRYKLTNMVMLENVVLTWNYFRENSKVKNIRVPSDFEMVLK